MTGFNTYHIHPLSKRTCDGCRLCCWTFNVDVPNPNVLSVLEPKGELRHCEHECAKGCALHGDIAQPDMCQHFRCPYIDDQPVHKPGLFQDVLESLNGNMGNFIPAISSSVPVARAQLLIEKVRSLPAYILIGSQHAGRWVFTILPLDKEPDGTWQTKGNEEWASLYSDYGETLRLSEQITI